MAGVDSLSTTETYCQLICPGAIDILPGRRWNPIVLCYSFLHALLMSHGDL